MRKGAASKTLVFGLALTFILATEILVIGAQASPKWRAQWHKTVEAAKKEGRVNIHIDYTATPVLDAGVFQKAFPGIRVVGFPGRSSEIRIMAERRAKKYIADVNIAGVTQNYPNLYNAKTLAPIKPALILPEIIDESRWWQGRHRYADPENQYVFIFLGIPQSGSLSYNSNLVNPKDFKSYWDLLDPKWKGKVETRDMRSPGSGGGALRFFYHNPQLGPKFIEGFFGGMDVTVFRGFRQGLDWLARGKFALCFGCRGADRARRQGLPVASFRPTWKEGAAIVAHYGTIALMDKAPHPNAAKVFINWFLSREGQLTLQKSLAAAENNAPDSLRIDISKDDIHPSSRRKKDVKYMEMFTPGRMNMGPPLKVFEKALAEAQRK